MVIPVTPIFVLSRAKIVSSKHTYPLWAFAKLKSIALSALAVAALASIPAVAGEDEFTFRMVRNPGLNPTFSNFLLVFAFE
jgi:hypothetical protein